jgi:hypothetical protein
MSQPRTTDTPRSYRPALEMLEDRLCLAGALTVPTIVNIMPLTATTANVTWSPVANETGYTVLLWNGAQAVPLSTVGANATSATVSGLPAGQQVWLRVEAFNAASHVDSVWQSVKLPATAAAGAPTLTAKVASPTEIDLHWTAGHTTPTGFNILEWNGTSAVTIATLGAGKRNYAVTGLSPATRYYFSLEVIHATGSATTDWVAATTPRRPITAPTHLTATSMDTQTTLNWNAAQGATGYRVYEWENGQAVQVGQTDAHTTKVTVTNLTPGTGYWFYVQAYNDSNSANSAWKWVTTTAKASPLLPPGNLTAHVLGGGQVELDWTASPGAVGYWVYDWTGSSWHLLADAGAANVSATLTGLKSGTHYFAVMAYTLNAVQYATSKTIKVTL